MLLPIAAEKWALAVAALPHRFQRCQLQRPRLRHLQGKQLRRWRIACSRSSRSSSSSRERQQRQHRLLQPR